MQVKKTRGRKPLPAPEKKLPITIFVKAKHYEDAKTESLKIQNKYS